MDSKEKEQSLKLAEHYFRDNNYSFAKHILENRTTNENVCILTHCNTGSLATGGYGTALGKDLF